jgi:hypothetical protein
LTTSITLTTTGITKTGAAETATTPTAVRTTAAATAVAAQQQQQQWNCAYCKLMQEYDSLNLPYLSDFQWRLKYYQHLKYRLEF